MGEFDSGHSSYSVLGIEVGAMQTQHPLQAPLRHLWLLRLNAGVHA